jgi:alkyl hydroperoxide reductase subunit AhpF
MHFQRRRVFSISSVPTFSQSKQGGAIMAARVDPDRSEWDVIVLGGAAAGENAAQYATQFSGLDAVLVEAELLGGECSY